MSKHWFVIVCITLLTGCASLRTITVTDPRTGVEYTVDRQFNYLPGIEGLAKACAEDAGQTINKIVEVEGYYNNWVECEGYCVQWLVEYDFNYIELNVTNIKPYSAIKQPGIWKVFKAPKDHPHCNRRMTELLDKHGKDDFLKTSCLVAQKQEAIESRYGVYFETEEKYLLDGQWVTLDQIDQTKVRVDRIPWIIKQDEQVIDHLTGKPIAQTITVGIAPRPIRVPSSLACTTVDINGFGSSEHQKILLPIRKGDL